MLCDACNVKIAGEINRQKILERNLNHHEVKSGGGRIIYIWNFKPKSSVFQKLPVKSHKQHQHLT